MIVWLLNKSPRTTGSPDSPPTKAQEKPSESGRETFDQLLYSFVLLIAGRAFLLEPFVIPTGSMAPTLYGRHKECQCSSCGYDYQVGASSEVDGNGKYVLPRTRMTLARCPNCRHADDITKSLAFNGDHVAVNKWSYRLGSPSRFDVFVFKFPLDPSRNYIKRLVGLPGETILIYDGDLHSVTDEGETILRKDDPRKRRAMTQVVYDDSYPSAMLLESGWPRRWTIIDAEPSSADTESSYDLAAGQTLRYTHLVANDKDWDAIAQGKQVPPRPQLISDFCGYNAYTGTGGTRSQDVCATQRGLHGPTPMADEIGGGDFWVPDVGFECTVQFPSDQSTRITLELVEGIYRYRCHYDASTGVAELVNVNVQQDPTEERPMAEVDTGLKAAGDHRIRFSNIDDELMFWIDDVAVDFGDGAKYVRRPIDDTLPTNADLSPASITVESGEARVSDIQVFRDVYYLPEGNTQGNLTTLRCALSQTLDDPSAYATVYERADENSKAMTVRSGSDGYLAFGDNSPRSNDSRLWRGIKSVPVSHLVGKAFWVYWPHGQPFLNEGRGIPVRYHFQRDVKGLVKMNDYPRNSVPFYPQFSRMKRIR